MTIFYFISRFLKIPSVTQCDELVFDILLSELKSSSKTFLVTTESQLKLNIIPK